jgi:hypothetical protein
LLLGLFLLMLFSLPAFGQYSVTLAWDPSPDDSVTGYYIWYGTVSQIYTQRIDAGNATTQTVSGLTEGVTYFFAICAYDAEGYTSDFSNEIIFTPEPPKLRVNLAPGGGIHLAVQGQSGHTYDILARQSSTDWMLVATVVAGATGSCEFTDPNPAGFPIRFYRLVETVPGPPGLQVGRGLAGQTQLAVAGHFGHTYDVLATQNLRDWTAIGTVLAGGNGAFTFSDPEAARFPNRFYRIAEPVPGPPRLQVCHGPAGQVQLAVTGQCGHSYDILATQNFRDWSFIGTGVAGAAGRLEFVDEWASKFQLRFYRVAANARAVAEP